jgi:hypothetical protein
MLGIAPRIEKRGLLIHGNAQLPFQGCLHVQIESDPNEPGPRHESVEI